jgi:hypothetical protein
MGDRQRQAVNPGLADQGLQHKDSHGETSYPVHYGLSMSNGSASLKPPSLGLFGRNRWRTEIDFTARQPLGQVVLARSTGNARYF